MPAITRPGIFRLTPLLFALSSSAQFARAPAKPADHQHPAVVGLSEARFVVADLAVLTWAEINSDPDVNARGQPLEKPVPLPKPADFNRGIYYRNKLEFSFDAGYLPINIPFPLDVFVGDNYNTYPLKYTLVPVIASLRWHLDSPDHPWIMRGFLRGNWDMQFSGSITAIPRGPETHYLSYDMGIRRNFVPHNSHIAPYFDVRLGAGHIDAKGPHGVLYAQGQNFTFTINMGSGFRYNFNPTYSFSAGLNFMHISNLDLSQHRPTPADPGWGLRNYGINVYGPMVGFNVTLTKPRHAETR